ncbi:MAG: hypothetical protein M3Y32_14970 [Pseudomonadota bacterium]|nr:hypothetical protein [Pseudomonadota bacterium]
MTPPNGAITVNAATADLAEDTFASASHASGARQRGERFKDWPRRDFGQDPVSVGGYGSSNDCVRELIRRGQDRAHLKSLPVEGAGSPIVGQADRTFFEFRRNRVGLPRKSAERR